MADDMEAKRKAAAKRAKDDEKRIKALRRQHQREEKAKADEIKRKNAAVIKAFRDAQKAEKATAKRRDAIRKANKNT